MRKYLALSMLVLVLVMCGLNPARDAETAVSAEATEVTRSTERPSSEELIPVTKEGLLACLVDKPGQLAQFLEDEAAAEAALSDEQTGTFVQTSEGTFPIKREQLVVTGLCTSNAEVVSYDFKVVTVNGGGFCPCQEGEGCLPSAQHDGRLMKAFPCIYIHKDDVCMSMKPLCGNWGGDVKCSCGPPRELPCP